MKNYAKLKCTNCSRSIDQLVDTSHYVPNKCIITLGCEGRLEIQGYTDNGRTIIGVPESGVTNWVQRGSSISDLTAANVQEFVSLSNGIKQQLVVAIKRDGTTIEQNASLVVNLVSENASPKDYRKYTFRKFTPISILNGFEDSVEKKILRYNITGLTPDAIDVYVDGVKRVRGSGALEYMLSDGVNSVPPNSISFNTPISGNPVQIDVVVTQPTVKTQVVLPFLKMRNDDSRSGFGTWEGVSFVKTFPEAIWDLFYCDLDEVVNLPLNVKLRINGNAPAVLSNGSIKTISSSNAAFLMSTSSLFTKVDRVKSVWIPFFTLVASNNYFTINVTDTNVKELTATKESVRDIFPLLEVSPFVAEPILTSNLSGNSSSIKPTSSFVIGPNA